LNEELHLQKLNAATAYSELSGDVDQALASFGAEAFRIECLRPVLHSAASFASSPSEPPYYEHYGEKQVAAGYYRRVVRYREHMVPLFESLEHYVEQSV
jgi:hypothetical protein